MTISRFRCYRNAPPLMAFGFQQIKHIPCRLCYRLFVIVNQIIRQFSFLIVKIRREIIMPLHLGQRNVIEEGCFNPWARGVTTREDILDDGIRKSFAKTGS